MIHPFFTSNILLGSRDNGLDKTKRMFYYTYTKTGRTLQIMRAFKYRCRDLDANEWIDMKDITLSFRPHPENHGKWIAVQSVDNKRIEKHNLLIMQYTGLYDDAGEEICENDICYAYKKGSGLNGYYKV